MISEERCARCSPPHELDARRRALIAEANAAGGRDNITVVLFRLEEVGGDGAGDRRRPWSACSAPDGATGAAERAAGLRCAGSAPGDGRRAAAPESRRRRDRPRGAAAETVAAATRPARGAGPAPAASRGRASRGGADRGRGRALADRRRRLSRDPAAVLHRHQRPGDRDDLPRLPYVLPAGIRLYETFYVSGVPASLVPPDRRAAAAQPQPAVAVERRRSSLVRRGSRAAASS